MFHYKKINQTQRKTGIQKLSAKIAIRHIEKNRKMTEISPFLSIITLNVSELNFSIKRQKQAEWIETYDPGLCCLQETYPRGKDTD